MITHDRYQTAIYAGILGVWTLNIVTDSPTIVGGPFCVCATDYYTAGAVAASFFNAGAVAADIHNAGAVATQGDCC